ncbi:MAG: hypothetical protein J6J16_09715 [Lachnospiraceae bacterium]|nr:hypothetical protein [Lachnospiraceae bacterium]
MDRRWMLKVLKERISELEEKYRQYFDCTTGKSSTYMGAACMRSRIKKDLGVCKLLEAILLQCSDSLVLNSTELENTFNRLVEPRRK